MRLVADGRVQVEGCHYSKGHYAATTLLTLVRLVLGATAEEIASEKPRGVEVSEVAFRVTDLKGAYLNAPIDQPTFIMIFESATPDLEEL